MARVRGIGGTRRIAIDAGWTAQATAAGAVVDPAQLQGAAGEKVPAAVPGTVAGALRAAGRWSWTTSRDLEAEDWWFTTTFEADPVAPGERVTLRFGGLATVAEVWLNGERLLSSESMFVAHAADVTARLLPENQLAVRFASLPAAMRAKKGKRPRWRTRLIDKQELRSVRTSLLGRMPSWSPPCPAVGPWREVVLERSTVLTVERASVRTRLEGSEGVVTVDLAITGLAGEVRAAYAFLRTGEEASPVALAVEPGEPGEVTRVRGEIRVPDAPLWWPHTHGAQPRLALAAEITAGDRAARIDLGEVAFRRVEVDERDGAFTLSVNGVRVFCRGACWVPLDVVAFASPAAAYAEALDLARAAGMNMIRVGGTMTYEDDAFHDACDARGILVWQDYQFANLDYPAGDPAFDASVRAEAEQLLDRLETSPSLVVLCGGSEVEQQAAMLGLPREAWRSSLFAEALPAISRERRPDVIYVPNSPSGGVLPFTVNHGVSHYYGVGAYLRPLEDARRAEVRFTSECLAFSNVPSARTLERTLGDGERAATHPAWKARVPRDRGVGWDFEDVRDHYLALLFRVDPMRLRYVDPDRYLALSRVVSGELMLSSIGEWRRARSTCAGALIWLYRDLWPGAGWGVVDAFGVPKIAYRYLARAMRPTALFLTDEGQSGLFCHVVNDGPAPLSATLEVTLYRDGEVQVARGSRRVEVSAHGAIEVAAESLFESFVDSSYAYRFGPPAFDVALAALVLDQGGQSDRVEAYHCPLGLPGEATRDLGLEASAEPVEGGAADRLGSASPGAYDLTVRAARFAYAVSIDAGPYVPDDEGFHLAPGASRTVRLRPSVAGARFAGSVEALNGRGSARIMVGKGKSA